MSKNVLVTGGAGFIGLNLIKLLTFSDVLVSVLLNKNDIYGKDKIVSINPTAKVYYSVSELLNNSDVLPPFDVIFHLASVGVNPLFNDVHSICDVNIRLGCELIDFAKINHSGFIVNFGSCFEYGEQNFDFIPETTNCLPKSLYAISKFSSTLMMNAYAKSSKVNLVTVRPFGVFGEGEPIHRLAPSVISRCMKGEFVETTEGMQVRDFVNVKDVCKAVLMLSNANFKVYDIYNICSNSPISVRDFICEIVDVCGFDKNLIKFD